MIRPSDIKPRRLSMDDERRVDRALYEATSWPVRIACSVLSDHEAVQREYSATGWLVHFVADFRDGDFLEFTGGFTEP